MSDLIRRWCWRILVTGSTSWWFVPAVVGQGNRQANALHKKTSTYVKASAQAAMMEAILEDLTEEELAVYKRGRNAKTVSMAKHATCTIIATLRALRR